MAGSSQRLVACKDKTLDAFSSKNYSAIHPAAEGIQSEINRLIEARIVQHLNAKNATANTNRNDDNCVLKDSLVEQQLQRLKQQVQDQIEGYEKVIASTVEDLQKSRGQFYVPDTESRDAIRLEWERQMKTSEEQNRRNDGGDVGKTYSALSHKYNIP